MDLSLTDSQQKLKDTAREVFEVECATSLVRAMEQDDRGYPADLWERISGLGWSGLPFPEELGGSGGTLTDLAVLLEEFGRALVPGPFFNSVAVVGLTLLDAGSDVAAFGDTAKNRGWIGHRDIGTVWMRTRGTVQTRSR